VVVMPQGVTTPSQSPSHALLMRAAEQVSSGSLALAEAPAALVMETPSPVRQLDMRAQARMKGYEGDTCGECGNYTMVRNGTCLKCDTCGSTSGCSWDNIGWMSKGRERSRPFFAPTSFFVIAGLIPANHGAARSAARFGDDKCGMVCKILETVERAQLEQRVYSVYMLASKKNGTLYIGVSSNLPNRITQHKAGEIEGFTKTYGVNTFVWFETFDDVQLAIQREKTMKWWPRQWKINVIERMNLEWIDLYQQILWK
jgi:putative endonuclease